MAKYIETAEECAAEIQALTPEKMAKLVAALRAQHPNCKGLTDRQVRTMLRNFVNKNGN